jgi:hypothetical protein
MPADVICSGRMFSADDTLTSSCRRAHLPMHQPLGILGIDVTNHSPTVMYSISFPISYFYFHFSRALVFLFTLHTP